MKCLGLPLPASLNVSCFLEQETLPLLLSSGWFQEPIRE